MKIFYDFKFLEDGDTIRPISVGMVREDTNDLYYIFADEDVIERAVHHDWLAENVVPKLPITLKRDFNRVLVESGTGKLVSPITGWSWDTEHHQMRLVKPRRFIADRVRQFIQGTPDVELWAWYGAYNHVALAQLWGPMVNLPPGIPMYTHDLKQECDRQGNLPLPKQTPSEAHDALADAGHNMLIAKFLHLIP